MIRDSSKRDTSARPEALAAVLVGLVVDVVEVLTGARASGSSQTSFDHEVAADQQPADAGLVAEVRLRDDVEAVVGLPVVGIPGVAVAAARSRRSRTCSCSPRSTRPRRSRVRRPAGRAGSPGGSRTGVTGLPFTSLASPEDQPVEAADRVDQEGRRLAAEAPLAASGVVEDQRGDAVQRPRPRAMPPMPVEIMSLNDIGCVSPQQLPDEGAGERHRRRAPEVDPVGARGVVVRSSR